MKHASTLLLFFSLTLLLASCGKDEPTPEPEKETYLKTVTVYMIPFRYGEPSNVSKFVWESETYNPDGLPLKREYRANYFLEPSRNSLWIEENTYEGGRLKERNDIRLGTRYRSVYTYDNSLLSAVDVYNANGLIEKHRYEYKSGNKPSKKLTWITFFDKDPTTREYTYDSRGNLIIEHIAFSPSSEGTKQWEYDSRNNVIKETYKSNDKEPVVHQLFEYKYDAQGRVSERAFSTLGSINFQKFVYHYDQEGRINKIDVFEENGINTRNYEQKGYLSYEYEFADK